MKTPILLGVLILSAAPLFAEEAPFGTAPTQSFPVAPMATAMPAPPFATAWAPPAGGETFTAPPIILGADGSPMSSQYQPCPSCQQGMGAPSGMMGPGYGPTPLPYGSPSGMMNPGMVQPQFPYTSLTPDVTMSPTTPNGPLPNRYNSWIQRYEVGDLPATRSGTDGYGRFGVFEFDAAWKYITPVYPYPAIFSFTQQYDLRLWNGPDAPLNQTVNLPGAVHRIGWDFELKTDSGSPWNAVVAFNPSINSDFAESLSWAAWNWDGRAALLFTQSPQLTYVFGFNYWDRVNQQVIPWVGAIYRPNQYWQWDLVFPQLRVSTYMWDEFGFRTSLYARAEYHSEAYEIKNTDNGLRDKVEIDDWRALVGFNKDHGDMAYFLEAGWIFGRSMIFKNNPQNVNITSGFIVRAGLRF